MLRILQCLSGRLRESSERRDYSKGVRLVCLNINEHLPDCIAHSSRVRSIPSEIAFEIALFPNNVPLPTARKAAWILGGALHIIHFIVRVSQIRKVPDSDLGWEDLYREDEGESWFDWVSG